MKNKYDKQFKEEALRLSDEVGTNRASEQRGIPSHTLSSWRKKRSLHGGNAFVGSGHKYSSTAGMTPLEIMLKRENSELQRANEILKDALGFFVKDRKK